MADVQGATERVLPSRRLAVGRTIVVLRAPQADAYAPVIDTLVEAGLTSIEVTLTTPGTAPALPGLVTRYDEAAEIGVGTVLTAADAEAALQAGAAYVVTPMVAPDVVAAARRASRPVYPGALTPTEVLTNWQAGATAVKIFPASHVGPAFLKALRGPFPDLALVPSGGIAIDDVPAWLHAGALAVSLGGELIGDALRGGDLDALGRRARRLRRIVDDTEPAHEAQP